MDQKLLGPITYYAMRARRGARNPMKPGWNEPGTADDSGAYRAEVLQAQHQPNNSSKREWHTWCGTPVQGAGCVKVLSLHYDLLGNRDIETSPEAVQIRSNLVGRHDTNPPSSFFDSFPRLLKRLTIV
jgi:hypothetical protein